MKIRAAVHVHSDWSHDGSWPLPRIAFYFKKAGYNCVLTSEHDETFDDTRWQSYRKACIENSTENFLIIPGIEYSDPSNIVHILVWGCIPFLGVRKETEDLLRTASEYHGVAVMAHPTRKQAWRQFRSSWAPLLAGVEQWNRKVDGVAPSQEAISLLQQRSGLLPFVGLDFHRSNQFFPLTMSWQMNGRLVERGALDLLRDKKVQAKVAGLPIRFFSEGPPFRTIKAMEKLRQYLRRMLNGNKRIGKS